MGFLVISGRCILNGSDVLSICGHSEWWNRMGGNEMFGKWTDKLQNALWEVIKSNINWLNGSSCPELGCQWVWQSWKQELQDSNSLQSTSRANLCCLLAYKQLLFTMAAPKVMPPILWYCQTMSEADIGGMAVEIDPSHQYSITFCCHVTDDYRGMVWQSGIWHGSVYEAKVCHWIPPGRKFAPTDIHWQLLNGGCWHSEATGKDTAALIASTELVQFYYSFYYPSNCCKVFVALRTNVERMLDSTACRTASLYIWGQAHSLKLKLCWMVCLCKDKGMKHWNPFHLCLSLFLSVLLRNTPKHPNKVLFRTRKDFFSHGLTSALWKLDTSVRISSDSDWCRWTVVTALLFDTHALANCIQKCNYFCSYLSPQYYYPCPPTQLSQGMTRFIS